MIIPQELLSFNTVKYQVEEEPLGSGLTSDVYLATPVINTAQTSEIAIKNVKPEFSEEFNAEIDILDSLDHPNILKLVGVHHPEEKDRRQLMALELCNAELYDLVVKSNGFTEEIARYFFFEQIVPAVSYMHIQGFCHRDLKLDNLFLTEDLQIKIADFSFGARMVDENGHQKLFKKQCGTVVYMAPEIQRGMKLYAGDLADIYSLGVILFMMVMGQNPFPSIQFYKHLWKNPKVFWSCFTKQPSPEFKNLIEQMLAYHPNKRCSMQDIRDHEWCDQEILTAEVIRQNFRTTL